MDQQPRVLIADDEIPYGDDRDRATRDIFRVTRPKATDAQYREGYEGMQGACRALRNSEFDLTVARRFKEAEDAIRNAKKPFDVAIIDLGWFAEKDLDDRETAGKRLVTMLRETDLGRDTRVIMSQVGSTRMRLSRRQHVGSALCLLLKRTRKPVIRH